MKPPEMSGPGCRYIEDFLLLEKTLPCGRKADVIVLCGVSWIRVCLLHLGDLERVYGGAVRRRDIEHSYPKRED